MGSVQRSKRSRFWIAHFKRWDAVTKTWRRTSVSTKCEDREAAENVLASLEATAAQMASLPPGTVLQEEDIRGWVMALAAAAGVRVTSRPDLPGILEWIERIMAQKARTVSAGTMRAYTTSRKAFEAWHGPDAPLDSFTPSRAQDYYSHLLARMATKSANDRLRWLSGVLNRAVREGLLTRNPCDAVDRAASTGTLQRLPFTLAEVRKLLKFLRAGDERRMDWARATLVALQSGARLADCVTMKRSAIRSGDPFPILHYTQGKTRKAIVCPLVHPLTAELLVAHRGRYLCPLLEEDYRRLGNAHLSSEFTDLVAAAGIKQKHTTDRSGRKVARKSFHSLRHTLRSAIVAAGGSDAQADLILGHSAGQGKAYTHAELAASAAVLQAALAPRQ